MSAHTHRHRPKATGHRLFKMVHVACAPGKTGQRLHMAEMLPSTPLEGPVCTS